ncbi:hypothetical protein A2U01_0108475, partial [Trifolium medium]|nr:hypothetical protein [Trifolium medium]
VGGGLDLVSDPTRLFAGSGGGSATDLRWGGGGCDVSEKRGSGGGCDGSKMQVMWECGGEVLTWRCWIWCRW